MQAIVQQLFEVVSIRHKHRVKYFQRAALEPWHS